MVNRFDYLADVKRKVLVQKSFVLNFVNLERVSKKKK